MTQIIDPKSDHAVSSAAAVLSKVGRRLIPLMCVLYLLAYLDRVNVGFAGLQMTADLHLSDAVFGFGAGIFFVGYFLFEVPSNLLLHRTGARRWIGRIMISWGIVAVAMIFVKGQSSFYLLRFLLGVAEAGFFPGMVLYLTYWFPRRYRARTMAWFFTSTAVAGLCGGPISGALLNLNGIGGLRGWQWLFLLEGAPSIVGGIACFFLLTDRPSAAAWLSDAERDTLLQEIVADETPDHGVPHVSLRQAFADPALWLMSAVYFTMMIGLYGISYWTPKVIQTLSGFGNLQVGWLSAIPYAVAIAVMIRFGLHSDRTGERRGHIAVALLVAAVGMTLLAYCHRPAAAVASLSLAAAGVWSSVGPFWAICGERLHGRAAAGGIAAINSLGNLGGFAGPYIIGLVRSRAHGSAVGTLPIAVALAVGALLLSLFPSPAPKNLN